MFYLQGTNFVGPDVLSDTQVILYQTVNIVLKVGHPPSLAYFLNRQVPRLSERHSSSRAGIRYSGATCTNSDHSRNLEQARLGLEYVCVMVRTVKYGLERVGYSIGLSKDKEISRKLETALA